MSADLAGFVREKLDHQPRDPSLFEQALTHASASRDSYDRLEFLGDRVLGLFVARLIHDRFGKESEGQMSKRLNALVAREVCAQVGRAIGVPGLVRLGKQARADGASDSDNVVGDVVEALIGALLIDGGMAAAEKFVLTHWGPLLDSQGRAPQHPKAMLQELAAARGCKAPIYEIVGLTGAHHAPRFTVRVSVKGLGEADGGGSSKQEAETAAASALLSQLSPPPSEKGSRGGTV